MSYADQATAPRVLTREESSRLLRRSGERSDTYRDHMLFALALGTGLREHELVALDVGDVRNRAGNPRQRIDLRVFKACTPSPAPQSVLISDRLRKKIGALIRWKQHRGQGTEDDDDPLFVSRLDRRLSTRRVRAIWANYREACELSPRLTFHALRHTFCQRLYEQTRDVRIVQRAARHKHIQTSTRYAAPGDDAMLRALSELD